MAMRSGMRGLGFAGEGGDDVAAEGGAWFGTGGRIAFDTGGVFVKTLLPVGTQGGVIEDGFGLGNRRCESIQGALAGRGNGTFVGVLHYISMGLTIAGAENENIEFIPPRLLEFYVLILFHVDSLFFP